MNKYPVYIVSKGRYKNPITAKVFISDNVDFKIVVEPQEYEQYCNALGEGNVLKLPFSNLGVGGYPARNFCWEHSIKNGHKMHWVFDDNIYRVRRLHKGKRIPVNSATAMSIIETFIDRYENIGMAGMNYRYFVNRTTKSPFVRNVHAYSALLIRNDVSFRWRLKYNEDVDLNLQFLSNNWCTILFNAFVIDKVTTAAKMKGGNQDELYKGNNPKKKFIKAKMLHDMWPKYVRITQKFGRYHHDVNWKKHFDHIKLKRRNDINWANINGTDDFGMKLRAVKEVKSDALKKMLNNDD
jgi:hypothetical protein